MPAFLQRGQEGGWNAWPGQRPTLESKALVSVEEAKGGTTEAPHHGTFGTVPLKHNLSLKNKS